MMNSRSELIQKIIQYNFDRERYWEQVKISAERSMLSESMCRLLLRKLELKIPEKIDFPNYLHRVPTASQLYGAGPPDIVLGHLKEDPSVSFGLRFLGPLFLLISGLTGYGKSTAIRVMLKAIYEYNQLHPSKKKSVIVFDRKGGDYADLPGMFGWKHFHFMDTLRLCLQNPMGILPSEWINIIATIFCARTGLKSAWVTFANTMRWLLAVLNPVPGEHLLWPDFRLLLEVLNAAPETLFASKVDYVRALKQPLEGIVQSATATFSAFRGFQVEDFIANGQSMVIAMPNMFPSWTRQLLADIILSQLLYGRIARSHRVNSAEVIIFLDEADADISAAAEQMFPDAICPVSQCYKQGREFGIGIIASCSSPCGVSPFIRANATTHMMFRMNDAVPIAETARTLMLSRGGELSIGSLGVGECLLKQAGSWPYAMIGKVDYMPASKVHIDRYDTHEFTPSVPLAELPEVQKALDYLCDQHRKNRARHVRQKQDIGKYALNFIMLMGKNPYIPAIRLFEQMGNVRFKMQVGIREKLEKNGLIVSEEFRMGSRNMILVELTQAGREYLMLGPVTGPKGRGSLVHRTVAFWIRDHFLRQKKKALIEMLIPGTTHSVDTAVEGGDKWDVFEISVSAADNLPSHIEACFEGSDAVNSLTIVAGTLGKCRQIEKDLNKFLQCKSYKNKIKYDVVETFLPKGELL